MKNNCPQTARSLHRLCVGQLLCLLTALFALAATNASAVTETFDSYTNGTVLTATGGGIVWTPATALYTVASTGGVNGSGCIGTDISGSQILNWKAQPFVWSTLAVGTKVAMSSDIQTAASGNKFDDDRVGWTVNADSSTSSGNQFALQLDVAGMECYWDANRTVLNVLSGIKFSTWYRFKVEYTKLTATSAAIVGTLTELDASGNPTGTPYVGTIADSSAAPYSAPTGRFTSVSQWPSYKNYNATGGNVDNLSFTITPPSIIENFDSMGSAGTAPPPGWTIGYLAGNPSRVIMSPYGGDGLAITALPPLVVSDGVFATQPTAATGFNFGMVGSSERALGSFPRTTTYGDHIMQIAIVNTTGGSLASVGISYAGEQWRQCQGTSSSGPEMLRFLASTTSPISGFTNYPSLDFTAPKQGPADIALDGNDPANRAVITGTITFASAVPAGGTFYLRWHDWNDNATYDHFLAIDDVIISGVGSAPAGPTVTIALTGSPMAEAAGVATVTATLSATSASAVTVNLAFSGTATLTTDYTASANSIVIAAGSTSGSITLTAVQDTVYENPNETIIVDIASVVNGTESGTQQVTATITDDDPVPVNYRSFTGTPITENFDGLGMSGTSVTALTGWDAGHFSTNPQQGTTGGNGLTTVTDPLVVDDGSHDPNGTPMLANFGTTGAPDRALGSFARTTPAGDQYLQLAIKNNSGSPITSFVLSYRGEEWRSANAASQQLTVWYSGTSPTSGFVSMSAFTFNSPNNTGSNVAIDGNAAGNFTAISDTYIPASPIAPGSTFYIRWYDINDNGIADDFFAIDDVTVTPTTAPPPQVQYVIVISVDGLGGTYLNQIFNGTATGGPYAVPNFMRLKNEGAGTLAAHIDNDNFETLPNHTSIMTGRPELGANGHNWTINGDPALGQTIHSVKGSYVASVFDVAHDNGLTTGMYANKTKFSLFDTNASYTGGGSYNATYGALDTTGVDNGRDKIDNTYIDPTLGGIVVDTFIAQQNSASSNQYAFIHINEPDAAGHGAGWGSAIWNSEVVKVDTMLGKIFNLIERDVPAMIGKTAIILTADHGYQGAPGPDTYSVPFYVWGPGVAAGADLYTLNASTRQVASSYPMTTYTGMQPIRNAEANNLALGLLGLGSIPGSSFDSTHDLVVTGGTPPAGPTVTLALTGSPMAEAAGVATVTATMSATNTLPVTVNLAFSGTATLTADYTPSATNIVIAAGSTNGSITLTAVQDAVYENPNETIVVDIDTVINATESGSQQVTAIITDDDPAPIPPNDNFADAIELPGNSGNLSGNNNIGATFEPGEPVCNYPATTNTVWFKWVCAEAGSFTLSTLGSRNTANAEWDAVIGVYTGSSVTTLTSLITPAQDTGLEEIVILPVTPGTYYIQAGGYPNPAADVATNIVLNWSFVVSPPPNYRSFTGTPITENFDGLTSTGTVITPLLGWDAGNFNPSQANQPGPGNGIATVTDTSVVVDDGTIFLANATASIGNLGTTGSGDRALGGMPKTASQDLYHQLAIKNDSGSPIMSFVLAYTGEQWASAPSANPDSLTVWFSDNDPLSGFVTMGSAFTFTAPQLNLNTKLDGNAAANRTVFIGTFTPAAPIAAGNTFYIRWYDRNDPAQDHVLAIDDLTVTPFGPPPTVTLGLSGSPMAEASGVATVTATLSAVHSLPVTVNLAFSGTATLTADYTRSATNIVIAAGSTNGSITLTAVQDAVYENPNETIVVDIDTVVNATESGTQQVTATITDDDLAPNYRSFTGTPITENFDGLGTSGTVITSLLGWDAGHFSTNPQQGTTGGNGLITVTDPLVVDDGSHDPNALPILGNFGTTGAADRALGSFARTTPAGDQFLQLAIKNDSGSPITTFELTYTGEEWRSANAAVQSLTLWYSATDATNGFVSMGTSFTFNSPNNTGGNVAIDGNATGNRTVISGMFTPATPIAAGSTVYIRWYDINDSGIADDFLAIDDLSFGLPTPAANILTFGPGATITGTNIAWSVPNGSDLTSLAPTYTLSVGATCDLASGSIQNFTSPVAYTVISSDSLITNVYIVTATALPAETTLVWNLAGNGAWDLSTINWIGQVSGSPLPFFNGAAVIFNNTVDATITIQAGGVNPASTTVNNSAGILTFSGGGDTAGTTAITGSGGLTKSGAGTLRINNSTNSYTGKTIIQAGQLQIASSGNPASSYLSLAGVNGALGAPTGADAIIDMYNGTILRVGTSEPRRTPQVTDRTINLADPSGPGTVSIRVNDNDTTFTFGAVTATGAGAKTLALTMGAGGNGDRTVMNFNGAISDVSGGGGSPLSLTVADANGGADIATLNLLGANTFTGPISLLTPGGSAVCTTVIGGSGSLAGGTYANTISMAARTVFKYASSTAQTLSGVISGAGAVQVTGSGTVTLSGANTYSGNTTVNSGGSLVLDTAGSLTFKPGNTTANKLTGAGTATLNGTFNIDTSAVTTAVATWTLVDITTKTYGGTFSVPGFTGAAGVWTKVVGPATWTFTEATGQLTLSTLAVFTSFTYPGSVSVIDNSLFTVSLTVPYGTVYATIAPTYTVSSGTCDQPNTAVPTPNFGTANPVTYTVTDGTTVHPYAVTITTAPAPIIFGATGAPLQTFNAPPVVTEWSTLSVAGGTADVATDGAMDTAMSTIAASSINTTIASKTGGGTSGPGYWRSENASLETRPTGNKATLLMAKLYNDSGSTVGGVALSYTFACVSQTPTEEIKGHRLYWSKTGAAGSWTAVGDFLLTAVGSTTVNTTLNSVSWANGGTLFVVWADDNGSGTDGDYTIDNVSFTSTAPAADMLTFGLPGNPATITGTNIALTVPYGTVLTSLAPTYTASSGATCPNASGSPQDFSTGPVHYVLTSSDSLITKDYTVTVTVAAAPPVLPVTAGLVVWLKADAVNPTDTAQVRVSGSDIFVKQWNDSSGLGNNATQTGATLQPQYLVVNGKPMLKFPAANDDTGAEMYLGDLSAQFPSEASLFAAATIGVGATPDGRYNLFGNRDNDDRWVANSWTESQPGSFRGGRTAMPYASWPQTGTHAFSLESSSTSYRVVVDGTQIGTAAGDYNSGSGQIFTIGDRPGNGQQLNGAIPELLLYNRVLSAVEADQVGVYLAAKYGLTTAYAGPAGILSFGIPGHAGVINQGTKTIALTVPACTDLATLAPTFTLTSGLCDQTSGSPPSPTFAAANPVHYIVTDGSTVNDYTVTVIEAAATASMVFDLGTSPAGTVFPSTGAGSLFTWIGKGTLPTGSILRSVTATAVKLEANPNGSWASDLGVFVDPTPETPGGPGGLLRIADDTDFGGAAENMNWRNQGQNDGPMTVTLTAGVDFSTTIDLSTAAIMIGNGYGDNAKYSGTVTITYDAPGSSKEMLTFTFPTYGAATISGTNITITVPGGTDVTKLSPTYTICGASCAPASGSEQDFTSPVHYIVTASDSSTKDYTVTVTVDQSITFGPLSAKTYGAAPFELTATASSGLTVSYTSSDPTVASVLNSTVTLLKVGTTTITASQVGNGTYNPATPVEQTLTVDPASLSITANSASKVYGSTLAFVGTEFTASGLVVGDAITNVTLISDGAAASAAVGTYDITPSAATGTGLGNYNIGYVKGTLTVNPVPVLITYDFAATDPVDPVASLQGWTQIYRAPVTPDNSLWASYDGWGWMPDDGHLGDGWEVIDTLLGRSPAFTLNGTGDLTFQLLGSASPLAAPDVAPSAIPEIAITNGGFMGVALRDAAADTYVLSRGLSTNNYGNTWTDLSFTAAELAPYANDGKHYTLDFIDYSKLLPNGDGWIIMAGASIPGKLVPPPPELPPTGFSMEGGTTPTFVVPTVLGFQYRMVFKDLLTEGSWTPVGAWTDGTGADVKLTDPNTAGVPHRFYRLQVQ